MLVASKGTDIEVDKKQVCRYIGYSADYEPPARISSLIDEYAENAHNLIEQSYSYVIKDIERVQGSTVVIEGSIVFRSRVIARLLRRCCKVAVFVATIGSRFEEMTYRLADEGSILQAAVLDAIGSDIIEKVADSVQDRIRELAGTQGFVISQRFSPGYCDWDIGQQKMVFRAVSKNSTVVRLNRQCLMLPRKSISGIIGIGLSDSGVEHYNPCKTCNKSDCPGRRGV